MITDSLDRIWSSCPRHLRELGCLREMLGIRDRYQRHRDAWEAHATRCRELILRAMQRCTGHQRALILGSGYLHDVPLPELAGMFREVILVDLFHPWHTWWAARPFPHVRLLAADITGVLEAIHRAPAEPALPLPRSTPGVFQDDAVDFTVSLNILSQLPCVPERYLKRAGTHAPERILGLARDLVQSHLDYLARRPGVVALIADTEIVTLDISGKEVRRKGTLYDVPFPYRGETWTWSLVPRDPKPPHHTQLLSVVGVEDIQAQRTTLRGQGLHQ